MREHYEAQLTTLNTEMIQMGALCEDAIPAAIQALKWRSTSTNGILNGSVCGFC